MVIHLISSPRTVSTSLMYSFDNRSDVIALDEPFYAYYLNKTGKTHPGNDEILKEMPSDLSTIFNQIDTLSANHHVFIKNMGHHTVDAPIDLFASFKNVFFIRHPKRVIASFSKVIEHPSLFDLGIKHQWEVFQALQVRDDHAIILDSTELLKNPRMVLTQLCLELNLKFDENMLTWIAGPRSIDGSWAKYWYASTHRSTGFGAYTEKNVALSKAGQELLEEALPYYELLFANSIHHK